MDKGITVKKDENFSEWYTQLIENAELADVRYGIKGFVVYREWAQMSMEKMYAMMSNVLDRKGHMPVVFPTLIHERNFEIEKEHVKGFSPEVFWVTETGGGKKLEEKYALRPTSETAFYQMYSLWIQSYRDLPYKRYQRGSIFRAEKSKSTRPFFRGKEFHWIEAHCVFPDEEGALAQVKEDMKTTHEVLYEQFGIPHLFFERPQWDKFPGAVSTFAADALMGSGKVLQLPSTHLLGTNFSKPFDVKYLDKDGTEKYCHITCYGPGISRIYGAMIALHSDDKGLRVPFALAPREIVLVPILFDENKEKVLGKCREIQGILADYNTHLDDREGYTPGWKFNQWEVKGVPIRIEIGPKDIEKGEVVVFRRDIGKKESVPEGKLKEYVKEIAQTYTSNLIKQAEQSFEEHTVNATSMDELKQAIKDNKIVRTCFCDIDMSGEACATKINEESGAEVRGSRVDIDEKAEGTCPICKKEAKSIVYIAKSY